VPELRRPHDPDGLGAGPVRDVQLAARPSPRLPGCGREVEETLSGDLGGWLVAHLDRPLLPCLQVIWGKPNEWQPPGDQGRG
jgi:hypothetical protein